MKKLLIFLILSNCIVLQAQTQIPKVSFQFNTNIIADYSNLHEKGKSLKLDINEGYKIKVIGQSSDLKTTYFKYWNFNETIKAKDSLGKTIVVKNSKALEYNNKLFEIPTEEFNKLVDQLYSRYKGTTVGVYTIPFRLRGIGNNFDFESSLSLQANIVAGFGSVKSESSWIDLSLGVG